jgi:hypothetical protein
MVVAGKSFLRGQLSTVNLLALSILDQLLFVKKYDLPLLQNKATLMRR